MNRRVLLAAAVLVPFIGVSGVRAGGIAGCDAPFVYGTAVNVYVLEDADKGASSDLQDIRKRLAWLAKLDVLFRDSYGSLGVHFLAQPGFEGICTLDGVVERVTPMLPSGGAAVFIDQRVYREGERILVQSYLRFFRLTPGVAGEVVAVGPRGGLPALAELLPTQRLAFPPRQLTTEDLVAIEDGFGLASQLYLEPKLDSPSGEIQLSPDDPVPFRVTDVRPDGWMHVDAGENRSDFTGWLHADLALSDRLRGLMPELDFVDGLVGYLTYLQARDDRFPDLADADEITDRAGRTLARFGERAQASEDGGMPPALAQVLRTAMVLENQEQVRAAVPGLLGAVQRTLPDSRLRDILGIARLAACCQRLPNADDALGKAARVVGLSGSLNDFQAALAIDPGNSWALANLEAAYATVGSMALPLAEQAPETASPSLRDAYALALTRLPSTPAVLSDRLNEIQTLRFAPRGDLQ